jgi:hypothetical protein
MYFKIKSSNQNFIYSFFLNYLQHKTKSSICLIDACLLFIEFTIKKFYFKFQDYNIIIRSQLLTVIGGSKIYFL